MTNVFRVFFFFFFIDFSNSFVENIKKKWQNFQNQKIEKKKEKEISENY
jgi:hypothetical protein